MAGIEKICEYSGEYPGPAMYGYKRDLIQVMPEYRKLFAKQEHTLFISRQVELWERFPGLKGVIGSLYSNELEKHNRKYYSWRSWRKVWERFVEVKTVKHREYCLYIPSLPGNVDGFYYNYTYSVGTMKRKLKRLLKVKKLNIVYVDNTEILWNLRKEDVSSTSKI